MTRIWKHNVSADWLEARKDVLTASEIRALIPEFKRMLKKPAGTISPGFFAFCGAKLSHDVPDTLSTGPAARGHIMEPYAVDDWNKNNPHVAYFHWDDLVIKRNGIGYSPDGLDIPQVEEMGVELWADNKSGELKLPGKRKAMTTAPTRAIEVKCYEPKQHMKAFLDKKEDRDERLQVAVAFMVLPKLKYVDVLWYCPEAPIPMFSEYYERVDLEEEIKLITEMLKMFHWHMKKVKHDMEDWSCGGAYPTHTTQSIYDEYSDIERNMMSI